MTRRGFALLAVLWVLVALTALSGAALAVTRTGAATTRNRVILARAGWAREACVAIVRARYAHDARVRALDTVDLGRGTWCRAGLEDAGAKLDVNLATPAELRAVLTPVLRDSIAVDSVVADLIERRGERPFAALAQVTPVVGHDVSALLSTRGLGPVDVNAASPAVLTALPGMTTEAVAVLADRQQLGRPIQSVDGLLARLSGAPRDALLAAYRDFSAAVSFGPTELIARVEGGVRGTPLVAHVTLTLVPAPGRLAVIRRETE